MRQLDRLAKIISDAGRVSPRVLAMRILVSGFIYDPAIEKAAIGAVARRVRELLREGSEGGESAVARGRPAGESRGA